MRLCYSIRGALVLAAGPVVQIYLVFNHSLEQLGHLNVSLALLVLLGITPPVFSVHIRQDSFHRKQFLGCLE